MYNVLDAKVVKVYLSFPFKVVCPHCGDYDGWATNPVNSTNVVCDECGGLYNVPVSVEFQGEANERS